MNRIFKVLLFFLSVVQIGYSQITVLEDFTDIEMNGWASVDADGDGFGWNIGYPSNPTAVWNANNGVALSYSFDLNLGALTPDNFLVSPLISFVSYTGNLKLRWRSGTTEPTEGDNYEEYYSVYLIDDLDLGLINTENFDNKAPIFQGVLSTGNSAILNEVNVSSFAGNSNLRLIFRHHNCSDEFNLFIDGISVENNAGQLNVSEYDKEEDLISVFWNENGQILNFKANINIKSSVVYDLNCRVVAFGEPTENMVDLNTLDAGIYILALTTDKNRIVTKKIIKN